MAIPQAVGFRLHHGHPRLAKLSHRGGLAHCAPAVGTDTPALGLADGQAAAPLKYVPGDGAAAALAAVGRPADQLLTGRVAAALLPAAGDAAGPGYGGHEARYCSCYL